MHNLVEETQGHIFPREDDEDIRYDGGKPLHYRSRGDEQPTQKSMAQELRESSGMEGHVEGEKRREILSY